MIRKRFKDGSGSLFVASAGESAPAGEAVLSPEEYAWAEHLAEALHEADDKRSFWLSIIENKKASPAFNVLVAWPKEEVSAPPPEQSPAAQTAEKISERARLAKKYGGEILEMLRSRKKNES